MRWFKAQTDEVEETAAPKGATREPVPGDQEKSEPVEFWWKPFWTTSAMLIFVGLLWSVSDQLWLWLDRPVKEIAVQGDVRHLDRGKLATEIAAGLEQSLLQVELIDIQELVREQPWVRVAAIKRQWPNRLVIEVEEEVPVARWGEHGLLNHQGDIFWPALKAEYRTLPRLSGPSPETSRVMSQFHDLNQIFRPYGLSVTSLDLEARGAWNLTLNNEIKVILGREEINQRLQRFLDLYQQRLSDRESEIEQIDIRYTNGVAIKWRELPGEQDAS